MNWLEIVGAVGGAAGIVALINAGLNIYKARGEKTKVDIANMEQMLHDSMERYDKLEAKFDKFQKEAHEYVESLRGEITNLKGVVNALEMRVNHFEKVVNSAWRCDYPDDIKDCPVIQEYERRHLCEVCDHKHKEA